MISWDMVNMVNRMVNRMVNHGLLMGYKWDIIHI